MTMGLSKTVTGQGGDADQSRPEMQNLPESPVLRIEGLRRLSFGPFSLALRAGECVAVTGPSGSGKSVLLRMIADLDPHAGEAWCEGTPRSEVRALEWRRRVTYCAAQPGWWADRVADHFADRGLAEALLGKLGLPGEILDARVERLSTGEAQRLSLLRAITRKPRVLLLDEPTSALDAENRTRVEALLREIIAAGTAVLFVTHDERQVETLAGRRFRMERGRLEPA